VFTRAVARCDVYLIEYNHSDLSVSYVVLRMKRLRASRWWAVGLLRLARCCCLCYVCAWEWESGRAKESGREKERVRNIDGAHFRVKTSFAWGLPFNSKWAHFLTKSLRTFSRTCRHYCLRWRVLVWERQKARTQNSESVHTITRYLFVFSLTR